MAVTGAIQSDTTLSGADIGVVIAYFVGVIGVGLFVSIVRDNHCILLVMACNIFFIQDIVKISYYFTVSRIYTLKYLLKSFLLVCPDYTKRFKEKELLSLALNIF